MPSLERLEIDGLAFRDFTKFWVKEWEKGPEEIDTSDLDNPVYDDTYAGIDYHRGPTWTFEFIIEGSTELEVLDNLDRVKAVWRSPKYTKNAGVSTELAFTVAGRRRIVYGRPRRFAESDVRTTQQGFISVLAEFKLMDPLQYNGAPNDGWDLTRLDAVPPDVRGLSEFLTEDTLTTEISGERQGQIGVVAGSAPTPFRCTLYGPSVNPGFTIDGRRYQFNTTLSASQRLVVDSRTGTVLRNGSTNLINTMSVPTRLKGVRLAPGRSVEISFFGVDPTLTSYAYFAVRAAYH
ncbi:hypothetical protein GCM10009700_35250 [Brevibacterium sanguinis]|uniref:hypothetical protein n=1 Tax=Brevibacterium sanguinis TaxID=232444 RepID=UPI0031E2DBA8